MQDNTKPIILTFIGHYLPGYKAGGILRSIKNTVDNLCDEFEFKVITRDRDLGDKVAYDGVKKNKWQKVHNASVYYLDQSKESLNELYHLVCSTEYQLLFLNSYFDPLTIKVLLNRKFKKGIRKPVIVAVHGEFAWASLSQKYLKKYLYIKAAKILGLYKDVIFRAASNFEANDIAKVLGVKKDRIHVAGDPPMKIIEDEDTTYYRRLKVGSKGFKIIFLSRIAKEKNLDYAIRVLSKVGVRLTFDIYGPVDHDIYWKECQKLIKSLPENICVHYFGEVRPESVHETFSQYDLFLFPSGGESYGHVIAESLTAGTPVLISTETPWRDLNSCNLGWDIDLKKFDRFVEVIEEYSLLSTEEKLIKRSCVRESLREHLNISEVLDSYRTLFKNMLCQ